MTIQSIDSEYAKIAQQLSQLTNDIAELNETIVACEITQNDADEPPMEYLKSTAILDQHLEGLQLIGEQIDLLRKNLGIPSTHQHSRALEQEGSESLHDIE